MDWKKIRDNLVKVGILGINVLLATGGVYYAKNQDQQKKETQFKEAEAYNKEVAKYEIDQIQQALKDSKIQKEESIAGNPDTVTKQETVSVKKTIPAVTEQVTVKKPSKSTKSS